MGMYDTVIIKKEELEIQFKHGEQCLFQYEIDDEIPLNDGIHFAPEGCFVVYNGRLVAGFDSSDENLCDKWGGGIRYPILSSFMDIGLRKIIQKEP